MSEREGREVVEKGGGLVFRVLRLVTVGLWGRNQKPETRRPAIGCDHGTFSDGPKCPRLLCKLCTRELAIESTTFFIRKRRSWLVLEPCP